MVSEASHLKEALMCKRAEDPGEGLGLFNHWLPDPPAVPEPEAGVGLFRDLEPKPPKEPEAGIGLFRHWVEDD